MTTWTFPCAHPADISIDSWASGSIVVSGEPTTSITVDVVPSRRGAADDLLDHVEVSYEDGQLHVHGPRSGHFLRRTGLDLTIKAPEQSSCAVRTASADLSCVGRLSALALKTASGDLSASQVEGDVTVRSASGDVLLGNVGGAVAVSTASGDIRAARVDGAVKVGTASGDVVIGYCSSSAAVRTASGDVDLGGVAAGQIELGSASGDVRVAVVPGIGVYLDLSSFSGQIRSDLDAADDTPGAAAEAAVEIRARTLTGDIQVIRSRAGRPMPGAPQPGGPQPGGPQPGGPQVDAPEADAPAADAPEADAPEADAPEAALSVRDAASVASVRASVRDDVEPQS